MVVMAPKDENELRQMLVTALAYNGPISFRYPRGTVTGVDKDKDITPIPIGKGEVLRKGDDILILAIGRTVGESLTAHSLLLEQGISSMVVNCRFVKPLDIELICSLATKIPRIISIEENVRQGGFGSAVLEGLHDEGITGFHFERMGISDTFVEHGPQKILRSKYGVDAQAVVNTAIKIMNSESH